MIPVRPEIPPTAPIFRPPRPRTLAWPDLRPPPTQTRPKANDPGTPNPSAAPNRVHLAPAPLRPARPATLRMGSVGDLNTPHHPGPRRAWRADVKSRPFGVSY
jgi:hypothetical protein